MEKLYQDFINGAEVALIKKLLKSMNAFVMTLVVLTYLTLLLWVTSFTVCITAFLIASLFITHFIKKWVSTP